jgi:hypothetical protein
MYPGKLETINDCSCPIYWAIVPDESGNYKIKPLGNFAGLPLSPVAYQGQLPHLTCSCLNNQDDPQNKA